MLSKVHVFEPSHILKRSCDKIGGQFLSSPGGLHPHGPGAGPLKVAVGPLSLYSLDPDPLPSRPCSQTCLVHFEINDLVISTEFFSFLVCFSKILGLFWILIVSVSKFSVNRLPWSKRVRSS